MSRATSDPPLGQGLDEAAMPQVQTPAAGVPVAAILGLVVLGAGLFLFLEGRRQHHAPRAAHTMVAQTSIAPAPPLRFPPLPPPPPEPPAPPPPAPMIRYISTPSPPPEPIIRYIDRPAPGPPPAQQPALGRLNEPALVVDLAEAASATGEPPARAAMLRNRAMLVPQGTLILAVLETPIDTSRPGPVRAFASEDTRGFDGARVLIPKGSRLLGEIRAEGPGGGQARAVVTWNRLLRPDGVAIRINSPATDALGGAGVDGEVNSHRLARLSSVALQTALTIGTTLATQSRSGSVIINGPSQVLTNAGQILVPQSDLKPSVRVKKGAAITIFVARDLDFSGAPQP